MADRLAAASLRPAERAALEAAVRRLREELGDDLHAVWLYGSRARGEPPHEESDVDLMVITRGGWRDRDRISWIVWDEADQADARPVDRDKIVLAGSA
jgi:predicted nucleotidyltransferase